ncbi:MAG: ferrochelatase, partial [Bacteroidia bacterium]|nr:ferrochelatase [Bacteroidia bacterium]
IGDEYNHLFKQHGGEKIQHVESLNSRSEWVEAVKQLVVQNA